jgi:hypothetical protein
MATWPTPHDVVPVVHDSMTSMSLHFKTLLDLMDKPGVSVTARRMIVLEISETLLLNHTLRYPKSFIRNLIQKFEDAKDIMTFDRRAYINCLRTLYNQKSV